MNKKNKKAEMLKSIGPWAAAIAILAYLFWRTDIDKFFDALCRADLFIYIPLIVVFIFIWFLLEGLNLKALFSHFGSPLEYGEVLSIRGTTYLLMVLSYSLGIGGIAYYLKRIKGIPLSRATGLVLFYNFSDIISLALMSSIGCALTFESSAMLEKLLILSVAVFFGYYINVIIFRHLPEWRFLKRIKNLEILRPFHEAGLRQYILIPFYRALYFSTFIMFFYFAVKAFNMDIPLLTLAGIIPIVLFIGAIPVTPSGLGTIQAAMLYFFISYSTEPNILAFSLVYSVSIFILRVPIGLFYLKRLGKPVIAEEEACEGISL